MSVFNKLPIYKALICADDEGLMKISLVDQPAVLSSFVAFDKNKEPLKFSVQDEEQRIIIGCLMRCDFPIYRYTKEIGEFYITYSADVIKQMSQKMFKDGNQNNINLMHQEGSDVYGVEMFQCFIKDDEKGISPVGFEDIENGSLFAAFKVENDEVWKSIKDGTFSGYSLEGCFELELVEDEEDKEINEIIDLISKIIK